MNELPSPQNTASPKAKKGSQRLNGALLSYGTIFANIAVALAFTPFLVGSLGNAGYGLLSIIISFVAYLNMLDFGLNDSLMRFFVGQRDDPRRRDQFLAQMLGFYAAISLLILAVSLGMSAIFPMIFIKSMSAEEILLLQQMIVVMSIGSAAIIAFNPVGALLFSAERFVFLKSLELTTILGTTLIMVALLLQGHGPISVVVVTAGGKIFQTLMRIGYAALALKVRIRFALPNAGELRPIIIYAAPIFVSVIVGQIFFKLDNIIIGIMAGAAPVTPYAIGVMFNKYFQKFATTISRVMTPDIIRRIDRGSDSVELTDVMIRLSRIQAIPLLLILSGLFLFGKRFILLWLGADYAISYYVMLAVLGPYALELIGNMRNVILQVHGLYWYKTAITGIMAAINIPLTIWLLPTYGVIGAAVSTGIGILTGYVLVALLLGFRLDIGMMRYYSELSSGILPVLITATFVGLAIESAMPGGWIGLAACIVLYTLIYGASTAIIGMNSDERALMRRAAKVIFR